mmetsp:Transcript_56551/g.83027  ORF Transcript_56551/g.83027 Transcript_56551/m.83027 type:complete len:94 (+) Transcript_56551:38-319(+)
MFSCLIIGVSNGHVVQSLDPTVQLSWSDSTYSPDEVKNSWGTTFGGSSTTNGKTGAYASGSSQKAFDMAYMLNGKFALKHDPTLTGRHTGKYL